MPRAKGRKQDLGLGLRAWDLGQDVGLSASGEFEILGTAKGSG